MSGDENAAYFYVLRCANGALYAGWTSDLRRRMRAHLRGTASRFTRSSGPVHLAAWVHVPSRTQARSLEARFKALSRREKLEAIEQRQAFGLPLRKPPVLDDAVGGPMPEHAPPVGEELRTLIDQAKTSQARISTGKGDIVFTFYPEDAPQHCAAFIKLTQAGFYDGLAFHRVEPGFVVQGGDPSGNGTGGPGYRLQAEFNARPHVRGTVAMARANHPDSAGSQFYLCLDDARFLDKQYTVFGQMTGGFETLDAIRVGDKMNTVTIEPKATS